MGILNKLICNIGNDKKEILKVNIKPDGPLLHLLSAVKVNVYYIICRYSKCQTNALFKG